MAEWRSDSGQSGSCTLYSYGPNSYDACHIVTHCLSWATPTLVDPLWAGLGGGAGVTYPRLLVPCLKEEQDPLRSGQREVLPWPGESSLCPMGFVANIQVNLVLMFVSFLNSWLFSWYREGCWVRMKYCHRLKLAFLKRGTWIRLVFPPAQDFGVAQVHSYRGRWRGRQQSNDYVAGKQITRETWTWWMMWWTFGKENKATVLKSYCPSAFRCDLY